jgi:hypothetical protein
MRSFLVDRSDRVLAAFLHSLGQELPFDYNTEISPKRAIANMVSYIRLVRCPYLLDHDPCSYRESRVATWGVMRRAESDERPLGRSQGAQRY